MTESAAAVARDERHAAPANGLDSYVASFRELDGGVPGWVRSLREEGFERFRALGFPTTRLEDWKYTNVSPIAAAAFRLAPAAAEDGVRDLVAGARLGAGVEAVFVNGRLAPGLSRLGEIPGGARVRSLAEALAAEDETLRAHLGRHARPESASFVALNLAFLADGAFVHVPRRAVVREPIHLVFVSQPDGPAALSCPRVVVVAEESAEVAVVETWIGAPDAAYLASPVTEIAVGPNASVTHVRVVRDGARAFHVGTVAARLDASGRFRSHALTLGGALVRVDVDATLDAEGAEASLDGLYMTAGGQHVDHHTTIDHRKPHGTSRELYKGVLAGRSTAVFNGKVYVRPNAAKSDAQQMNKNLLLSEEAEVDTKPQLEIFADDVKCSHGATIGRLDETALFYLRSRGIGAEDARDLLIYAFANEIVRRIGVDAVRDRLERVIAGRLGAGPGEEAE